jgi:pteridine reductase
LADIRALNVRAEAFQANVASEEGVAALFDALDSTFGRLDVLVNSASVFPAATLDQTSLKTWQTTLDVNLTAPFLCTQQAAIRMQHRDPATGVVINICDVGTLRPWKERAAHGISKAALWMLTQTSAITYAPGIRVNAVMPGPVLAPPGMSQARWQQIGEAQTLQGAPGEPEDIARAVAYLATEPFITGALLPVNGGEHLKW